MPACAETDNANHGSEEEPAAEAGRTPRLFGLWLVCCGLLLAAGVNLECMLRANALGRVVFALFFLTCHALYIGLWRRRPWAWVATGGVALLVCGPLPAWQTIADIGGGGLPPTAFLPLAIVPVFVLIRYALPGGGAMLRRFAPQTGLLLTASYAVLYPPLAPPCLAGSVVAYLFLHRARAFDSSASKPHLASPLFAATSGLGASVLLAAILLISHDEEPRSFPALQVEYAPASFVAPCLFRQLRQQICTDTFVQVSPGKSEWIDLRAPPESGSAAYPIWRKAARSYIQRNRANYDLLQAIASDANAAHTDHPLRSDLPHCVYLLLTVQALQHGAEGHNTSLADVRRIQVRLGVMLSEHLYDDWSGYRRALACIDEGAVNLAVACTRLPTEDWDDIEGDLILDARLLDSLRQQIRWRYACDVVDAGLTDEEPSAAMLALGSLFPAGRSSLYKVQAAFCEETTPLFKRGMTNNRLATLYTACLDLVESPRAQLPPSLRGEGRVFACDQLLLDPRGVRFTLDYLPGTGAITMTRSVISRVRLARLLLRLAVYRRRHGRSPDALTELAAVSPHPLVLEDAWGRPVLHETEGPSCRLISLGEDGVRGACGDRDRNDDLILGSDFAATPHRSETAPADR